MDQSSATLDPSFLPAPSYRDRRTGLILFGVLEVLLGISCLLMASLVGFIRLRSADPLANTHTAFLVVPFYVGPACVFIPLGIGSMMCRRWARTLLLILGWIWLGWGLLAVPMLAWFIPRVLAGMQAAGQALPAGAITVFWVILLLFTSVFFILLPGALVLFYRSPHVKATCEARDPIRRWTDNCPPPALAVACLLGCGSVLLLGMSLAGLAVVPFFGMLVSGLPGSLLMLAMAAGLAWMCRSWYRLQLAGWWALVAVTAIYTLSNLITFTRVEVTELYQKMGYSQAQIDLLQQQAWFSGNSLRYAGLIWLPLVFGYLLWVRRFFQTAR